MTETPKILLHRAGMPENTLKAIRSALEYKEVDGFEIDIRPCKDTIVVFHDKDLSRATRGKIRENLKNLDYSSLKKINVFGKEYVPSLYEVVLSLKNSLKRKGLFVKLDIKEYDEKMKRDLSQMIDSVNGNVRFIIDIDHEMGDMHRLELYRYWKGKRNSHVLLEVPGRMNRSILESSDIIGYTFHEGNVYSSIPIYIRKRKMVDVYIANVSKGTLKRILMHLKKYNPNFITPNYMMNVLLVKNLIKMLYNCCGC